MANYSELFAELDQIRQQQDELRRREAAIIAKIRRKCTQLPSRRDMEICAAVLSGGKQVQVAAAFNISRVRVSQIVDECTPFINSGKPVKTAKIADFTQITKPVSEF